MKLPRPYVPIATRVIVARRQFAECIGNRCYSDTNNEKPTLWELKCHLAVLQVCQCKPATDDLNDEIMEMFRRGFLCLPFPPNKLHLDHDPPLAFRQKIKTHGVVTGYKPDANDPDYLVYRSAEDHKRKTYSKGDGAQYPDRVRIKKIRRIERPKAKKKYRWPKQKIRWSNERLKSHTSTQSRAMRLHHRSRRRRDQAGIKDV